MRRKPTSARYRRIAPFYDVLELPFEILRYRPLRRVQYSDLSGTILEAGVGTGRNMPFYPTEASLTAFDASPEMLARAEDGAVRLGRTVTLLQRDVRDTGLPARSFDAVVASFLFCVLAEEDQLPALQELARCQCRELWPMNRHRICAGTASAIDTEKREVIATFVVGNGPNGITFRPGDD